MVSPIVDKTIKQLRKSNLSLEDRTALTAVLLDKIGALPLINTLIIGPKVIINGNELDVEQTILFRDSCISLKDNYARKVIREQIKYLAINEGVHKGFTPEQINFSKAALWNLNEEQKLLDQIV